MFKRKKYRCPDEQCSMNPDCELYQVCRFVEELKDADHDPPSIRKKNPRGKTKARYRENERGKPNEEESAA